jgi:PPM family protein phosphatase
MAIESWCKTDKGLKRETNQDSFLINQDFGLFVVADGMGGHSGGEVASALATQAMEDSVVQPPNFNMKPRDILINAYSEASRRIYDKAAYEKPELMGMGTTMVSIYRAGNSVYICNVGDSRCYLYRKPHLWLLTEDHSLVNEQLRAGLIDDEQAKNFASRNVITRSVGYERDVLVDIIERPLTKGDVFILCSDGLSSLVPDPDIEDVLNKCTVSAAVDACVAKALENGGSDNVTVMFVSVT